MLDQLIEAPVLRLLIIVIHLDRLKRADLHADLALHADADIDIEHFGALLRLALLVAIHDDVNALRRALDLANLAGHAAHRASAVLIIVVHEERERARILGNLDALLGILDRHQPLFVDITPDEIAGRDDHTLEQTFAYETHQRSTSPSTMSMLPRMMTTSATLWPRHISSRVVRLMKLGGRTW